MLSKIINNTAEDCGKTKLNKLKKISTLLNIKNLPNSLLSILKRLILIIIFVKEKISLSLLNFILKNNLLKQLMPNKKDILIKPSYGYHKININDFKQDLNMKNIVMYLHLTNYNLLENVL